MDGEKVTLTSADIGTLNVAKVLAANPLAAKRSITSKDVFCAHCQAVKEHKCYVDHNTEVVCECSTCGHFLKFPVMEADKFAEHLQAHHESNKGQVSAEMEEALRAQYDDRFKKMMGVS